MFSEWGLNMYVVNMMKFFFLFPYIVAAQQIKTSKIDISRKLGVKFDKQNSSNFRWATVQLSNHFKIQNFNRTLYIAQLFSSKFQMMIQFTHFDDSIHTSEKYLIRMQRIENSKEKIP